MSADRKITSFLFVLCIFSLSWWCYLFGLPYITSCKLGSPKRTFGHIKNSISSIYWQKKKILFVAHYECLHSVFICKVEPFSFSLTSHHASLVLQKGHLVTLRIPFHQYIDRRKKYSLLHIMNAYILFYL